MKSFENPAWIEDLDEGIKMAEETGKPLFVDIGAEWCIACHELEEFTFSDPEVIKILNEKFIPVKLDGTEESDPVYKKIKAHFKEKGYPIMGLPAVFIHNTDGEIVETVNKFIPAEEMLPKLQAVVN